MLKRFVNRLDRYSRDILLNEWREYDGREYRIGSLSRTSYRHVLNSSAKKRTCFKVNIKEIGSRVTGIQQETAISACINPKRYSKAVSRLRHSAHYHPIWTGPVTTHHDQFFFFIISDRRLEDSKEPIRLHPLIIPR